MTDSMLKVRTAELRELLTQATRRCLTLGEHHALLFSGGLDSSVLAAILSGIHSIPAPLIVAGSSDSKDIEAARQAAGTLDFPLEVRQFTIAEVIKALPSILTAVGTTDVLQVSLAIPLHFAASRAQELGVTVLLSGQGADELFGGYARYERSILEGKTEAADAAMRADFERLLQITLPKQEAIARGQGIQLAAPYLDEPVVAFAEQLPLHYKLLRTGDTIVRKRILRNLAVNLKLPSPIAEAPKRAAQFGSGATRLLTELATSYWRQRDPSVSVQESRRQMRIRQFLDEVREKTISEGRTT
jgi:asparagine synthase (glutamine-hydrolysing)